MQAILATLKTYVGEYQGTGQAHDGQTFEGHFTLSTLPVGHNLSLSFVARGPKGDIFHQEVSWLAPDLEGSLVLWTQSNNVPSVVPHRFIEHRQEGEVQSLFFRFGEIEQSDQFREEIRLELHPQNRIAYHYSWGLPGGDFCERSGLLMTQAP